MKKLLNVFLAVSVLMALGLTLVGCGIRKDKNIASITIIETTVPSVIEVGEFDNVGIKAIIAYVDQSKEEITITSSMLSQQDQAKLSKPGIYCVEIIFQDVSTQICIKIVQSTYTVNFYDPYGDLISTQQVVKGEDAVAPTDFDWNCDFVAWDRLFDNVTEDIKVYAIGSNCQKCPLPLNTVLYASDSKYDRYDVVVFNNGKVKYFTTNDKDITEETIENSSVEYVDYDVTIMQGKWIISFEYKNTDANKYTYSIEFDNSEDIDEVIFNQNDTQQAQKNLSFHPDF